MDYKKEEKLKDRIEELKRTINFLCNGIQNIIHDFDENNSQYTKILLKELINDNRYRYE